MMMTCIFWIRSIPLASHEVEQSAVMVCFFVSNIEAPPPPMCTDHDD